MIELGWDVDSSSSPKGWISELEFDEKCSFFKAFFSSSFH
jgi:hypothetical protein